MRNRKLLVAAFLSLSFLFGFKPASADDLMWHQIGPQPLIYTDGTQHSGQVNALAVDPRNSSVVYLGADGGGVWKTTDGGQTWIPLTDNQPSLQIGALALDPTNPDIVYAGTSLAMVFSAIWEPEYSSRPMGDRPGRYCPARCQLGQGCKLPFRHWRSALAMAMWCSPLRLG